MVDSVELKRYLISFFYFGLLGFFYHVFYCNLAEKLIFYVWLNFWKIMLNFFLIVLVKLRKWWIFIRLIINWNSSLIILIKNILIIKFCCLIKFLGKYVIIIIIFTWILISFRTLGFIIFKFFVYWLVIYSWWKVWLIIFVKIIFNFKKLILLSKILNILFFAFWIIQIVRQTFLPFTLQLSA